jgi:hypothetical protein
MNRGEKLNIENWRFKKVEGWMCKVESRSCLPGWRLKRIESYKLKIENSILNPGRASRDECWKLNPGRDSWDRGWKFNIESRLFLPGWMLNWQHLGWGGKSGRLLTGHAEGCEQERSPQWMRGRLPAGGGTGLRRCSGQAPATSAGQAVNLARTSLLQQSI